MATVRLKYVSKRFGDLFAVDGVDFAIEDGEFVVLVGPSGCGKTTTLRLIAGLESPSAGEIYIGDQLVNHIPPKDRDIAMVFQNYALYPHMNVFDNMAFGLKLRRMARAEIQKRVKEAAALLGITDKLTSKPKELSGGQRQRVALGRAIVRHPKVFLFDEPLSNLDAKLRVQMRAELKRLHYELRTTTVLVTHDQIEAMTLGDRVVVMNQGAIQQVDTPQQLYDHPANLFVAGFMGSPAMNFLDARVVVEGQNVYVQGAGFRWPLPAEKRAALIDYRDREVVLGIRPEDLQELPNATGNHQSSLALKVKVVEPLGDEMLIHCDRDGVSVIAQLGPRARVRPFQEIHLAVNVNVLHLFDKETGKALN